VDRGNSHSGNGWTDQLGTLASGGPTIVVSGIEEAVKGIKKWMAEIPGAIGAGLDKKPAPMGLG
jgi:2-haloacid dehalogenase